MIAEKIGGVLFLITASVLAFVPTEKKETNISILTKSIELENEKIEIENSLLDKKIELKIKTLKEQAIKPITINIDTFIDYRDSFIIYDTIYSFRRIKN